MKPLDTDGLVMCFRYNDMFPPDAGKHLAEFLIRSKCVPYDSFPVDLTSCKPVQLIGAFFHSFLQAIYDHDPATLESARRIDWRLPFDFQRENVAEWVRDFRPMGRDDL